MPKLIDMTDSKVSLPIGVQSPDVLEWSKKLRSRSPSPTGQLGRSSDFKLGKPISISGSHVFQNNSMALTPSKTRRSTGNMAADFSITKKTAKSTSDLDNIEAEYIKNLQQQIYFLELEANYLRDQATKATEIHPQMTAEAERMLIKLRQLQSEVDSMQVERKRKDASIAMADADKQRLTEKINDMEDKFAREKRMLMEELLQIKKEKDLMLREGARKDAQLAEARNEIEKTSNAIKNAELKLQTLRSQLEQKSEQHKLAQLTLDEKRAELLAAETQLHELEDKYYSSTSTIHDKVIEDIRDETRMLQEKLKAAEISSEQDRFLRDKMADDSSQLVKENAALSQQIIELQKQLMREKSLRETNDGRRAQSINDFVQMKDRERDLLFEIEHLREQTRLEQNKSKELVEQLSKQESLGTSSELQLNTTRSRVAELETLQSNVSSENIQLRKDKMLLVDHVADLQKRLDAREQELASLRGQVNRYDERVKDLEHMQNLEQSVQSQKWVEFEKLAENMRSLSHSMAHTTVQGASKIPQY